MSDNASSGIKRGGVSYRPRPTIGGTAQDTADRLPPPQKPNSNPPGNSK